MDKDIDKKNIESRSKLKHVWLILGQGSKSTHLGKKIFLTNTFNKYFKNILTNIFNI